MIGSLVFSILDVVSRLYPAVKDFELAMIRTAVELSTRGKATKSKPLSPRRLSDSIASFSGCVSPRRRI